MHLAVLKTLVVIAEQGSFAAAARALDLSQSAVSLHVHAIEAELGRSLFDRSARPPILTEAGTTAVARAKEILALADDLCTSLSGDAAVQGRLQLGAVGSTLTGLLPLALSAIRTHHPGLHVEIVSGVSSQLLAMVQRRRLDAAIVSDYEEAERTIEWRPFVRERLVLIAPPDTSETDVPRLVRAHPFIRYNPSAAVGRVIDRAISELKLEPRESMRLDWLEAIEAMVANGHGVAIVPDRHVRPLERVRAVALPGPGHFRTLGMIETVGNPRRRLTDLVFAKLFELHSGIASPAPGKARKPKPGLWGGASRSKR
ncbi:MAG: LysR family transcriptional regulator [Alphaproteobacteria bacterium]|nr:LysR family transcriptional regulator [Alphaproteobacteria bacterium]